MNHKPIQLLNVFYHADKKYHMGRLAAKNRKIWFEYSPEFIATGFDLSPFKLPLQPNAVSADTNAFDGLHGIFNDSLPDGWGRMLLDRQAAKYGIASHLLTPLDRLSHVGKYGMGALLYEPEHSEDIQPAENLDLMKLAKEMQQILEGEGDDALLKLKQLAGSSGGARPKITAKVSPDKKNIMSRTDNHPDGYEDWLIKFNSRFDDADSGRIEYAYSIIAKDAGINMPETYLFSTNAGSYFGVQRFDRDNGRRIHMHSLCGLIHSDYRFPSLDYSDLLKVTQVLTKDMREVEAAFRLACFNVFMHNRDDHSKNFSFLYIDKEWKLSPAYDLTFSSGPNGYQSMTVAGESLKPTLTQLKELGTKANIKKPERIIDQVMASAMKWKDTASGLNISDSTIKTIDQIIDSHVKAG